MTSRERLLAAYRLQETDRLPMYVWGVRVWDREWVETRDESYRPVIEAVAEHGDFVDAWGAGGGVFYSAWPGCTSDSWAEETDDWTINHYLLRTPGGDLTTTYLSSKRGLPGMQREFQVKSLEDVEKVLSVPYEPLRPDCSGFFDKDRAIGDRGLVRVVIPNAISMLHDLMGSELLAIWSLDHRDVLEKLLWTFHGRCLDLLDYLLDQGVGPVFAMFGEEYVTPPLHSAKDFRAFVVEPEQEIAQRIHAWGGLLHVHCHGPMHHILEDFVTLGADCLHPIEPPPMGDVTLEDAKRRIGDRICIEGNIQIGDLYAAPTAQIVAQVRHNIKVTGGIGYILCPTASPHTEVLTEQTVRNYLAMVETATAGSVVRGPGSGNGKGTSPM